MTPKQTRTLTLTAQQVTQLRDHLLQDDRLERIAYVYCSRSGDTRFLAEELILVTDDQLLEQSETRCRPALDVERNLISTGHHRGMDLFIVHSHPFDSTEDPEFSGLDHELIDGLQTMVTDLYPDTMAMFGVFSTRGLTTTIYNRDTQKRESVPVDVIGNETLDTPLTTSPGYACSDTVDKNRYDRNIRAITEDGQTALAHTHVAVIGAGGLGSIMAEQFARYGVQNLTVVDPDAVEESNLSRLFGAYDYHVGRPKVEAVKEHLYRCNPDITVTAIQDSVQNAEDALKDVDLIVAGVDQVSARMWLNQYAVRHLKPYVDAGVVITTAESDRDDTRNVQTMEGYIQFIQPGATACFDCLDRGDPEQARIERLSPEELEEEIERGYIDGADRSPEPAVVPLNGIIASKTVQLVAKHVTGYAPPEDYLRFEGVENTFTEANTHPTSRCSTCGDTGILGRGDRIPTEADLYTAQHHRDMDIDFGPEEEESKDNDIAAEEPGTELTPDETGQFATFFDKNH